MSVSSKILSNILYIRIKGEAQDVMQKEQAGFRKDRGWSNHIFVLRRIIKQCEEWQIFLDLVDFWRAFDCIHRPSTWRIIELHGIPRKIVNFTKSLYVWFEGCVQVNQGHIDCFNVDSGVKQGDSLSSLLFNILLDFIMKRVEFAGRDIEWNTGRRLRDLARPHLPLSWRLTRPKDYDWSYCTGGR